MTTTQAPTRFLDVLPVRGGTRGALEWFPVTDDDSPQAGFVKLTMQRDETVYVVTESPVSVGRGFMLSKLEGKGTAPKRVGYFVTCIGSGDAATGHCECDGWQRHRHCKHFSAVSGLIANGWL